MLIMRDALHGMTRFDQFQTSLGIAPNMLTRRLNSLVEAELLERRRYSERPPRYEYLPTARGRDFFPVLVALLNFGNKHFATDGKRVVIAIRDPETQNSNLWMMDVERGVMTRFTFDPQFIDLNPQWSFDSKFVFFSSNRVAGRFAVYRKAADGAQPEQLLVARPDSELHATTVSPDGRFVAIYNASLHNAWVLPLAGNQQPYQFFDSKDDTVLDNWTPDERWVLFTSNQTGRRELYVTTFPQPRGRWQISSDGSGGGGIRSDGKKIIYVNNERKIITVDFDGSGTEPRIGKPEVTFGGKTLDAFNQISGTADWKRFLAGVRQESKSPRLTLVTNWLAEMEKMR